MAEITGMIMIISIIAMLEINAMRERYKIDMSIMDVDGKVEEILLMLSRVEEKENPKLVRATDVVDVLSGKLDIPICELVDVMAAVPRVEIEEQ